MKQLPTTPNSGNEIPNVVERTSAATSPLRITLPCAEIEVKPLRKPPKQCQTCPYIKRVDDSAEREEQISGPGNRLEARITRITVIFAALIIFITAWFDFFPSFTPQLSVFLCGTYIVGCLVVFQGNVYKYKITWMKAAILLLVYLIPYSLLALSVYIFGYTEYRSVKFEILFVLAAVLLPKFFFTTFYELAIPIDPNKQDRNNRIGP